MCNNLYEFCISFCMLADIGGHSLEKKDNLPAAGNLLNINIFSNRVLLFHFFCSNFNFRTFND